MSTDSPSPAEVTGQITKVLGLLHVTAEELQVIIDHPAVRENVRKAWRQAIWLPRVRLVRHAFHVGDHCSLTNLHSEAAELDFEPLWSDMDQRLRTVAELRCGFRDGKQWSLEEVAKELGVTRERVRQLETRAYSHLRSNRLRIERAEREARAVADYARDNGVPEGILAEPIEFLDLSERARTTLRRTNVQIIGQLVLMTPDDLLAIINFGQRSLDEVIERLAAHGLKLFTR